ncbi:MAG: fluoride efflux transporter CrcB [Armatimonadota bacterium]
MAVFQKILWLAFAGACGTVSRFALCELASKAKSGHFPLGTFSVNIIGSFLFGLIYAYAQKRLHVGAEIKLIMLTGFMGAFTTFSTFAFDTAKMIRAEQWMLAAGNVFGQITLGVLALYIGVLIGRQI